ncbi:MAG: BadF/BadG/BcrA/BcrD ATPase family protein [Propionicimonas sp.]|nr:BadF/BadG/BcrA/BcrD ATPase family protein [Propionicimonas sp.]
MAVLAIDSGQTAIKVALGDQTFSFPGVRTNVSLLPQLADVVSQVVARTGTGADELAIGTTGLTAAENDPDELLRLCAPHGVRRVLLAHDSVTSFLGAVGNRRGVVCAAGTGVITFGVGAHDVARVDGWGHIIGDAGSGFWIGREALNAVLRAHDGRGPATALTEAVQRRFPDLEDAYIELQTDPDQVRVVASFARVVGELAPGDVVAAAICERAGEQLAHSCVTAAERIGETDNPLICLVGGVFTSEHVRAACVAALRRRWPGFAAYPAQGDGLAGARALPSVPDDHPLASLIARSGAPAVR